MYKSLNKIREVKIHNNYLPFYIYIMMNNPRILHYYNNMSSIPPSIHPPSSSCDRASLPLVHNNFGPSLLLPPSYAITIKYMLLRTIIIYIYIYDAALLKNLYFFY